VRVRRVGGRPGRRLCWGLLTALLLVPTLAGAIIAVGASLVVQTLSETGFRVCLALALYGVAPTITLAAVLVLGDWCLSPRGGATAFVIVSEECCCW